MSINNLTKCKNCGNAISKIAKKCPNCGSLTKQEKMDNCRSCKKPLVRSKHLSINYSETIQNGTTKILAYNTHSPCPYCGDPKPLITVSSKKNFKIFSILTLIFGIIFAIPYFDNDRVGMFFMGLFFFPFALISICLGIKVIYESRFH